ncbi:hypothetical protein Tco_1069122 [Tanacetum coccineum]|uniref:Uncharacterized protein n=1 Tax=Tanacetum coccineum TaxID=301880 RepID=A0ABQ5HJJ4_9ASTR
MVINSPCLTDKKELASPEQTVSGKDFLNPLIVDRLLKTIWFINAPCFGNEALAIPGQTATGKEFSNPLMADSLPKTILSTKISKLDCLLSSEVLFEERLLVAQYAVRQFRCPPEKVCDEAIHKEYWLTEWEKAATTLLSSLEAEHDSGGYTPGSDEGSKKLNELMKLCTKLSEKVTSLEQELKQTKQVYGKALTKLVKKVKHLEDQLKSTAKRRKAKVIISNEEEDLVLEDPSKQGRMSETEYEDVETKHAEEVEYGDILEQITPSKAAASKGSRKYWKIIRVRDVTVAYQSFEDMLKGFDREDLVALWSLV